MDTETADVVLTASRALLGVVARSMGDALDRVTLPQFRALTILTTGGPISARTLADELEVTPSTMSRSAERLVAGGWVRREDNPDDRRETMLVATDQARALISDVAATRRRLIEEVIRRVPAGDINKVRAGFARFVEAAGEPVAADTRLLGL